MKILHKKVLVRVPATTSNLGPGFDVLGLALDLHNEVILEILSSFGPDVVEIAGEGENSLPRDKTNMVLLAIRAGLPRAVCPKALHLSLINRIPIARGLGSSAAARLGGILAAHALCGLLGPSLRRTRIRHSGASQNPGKHVEAWTPAFAGVTGTLRRNDGIDEVLDAACRLEGHPDNVVPAFYGGLCAAIRTKERILFAPFEVPRELGAVSVCPISNCRLQRPEKFFRSASQDRTRFGPPRESHFCFMPSSAANSTGSRFPWKTTSTSRTAESWCRGCGKSSMRPCGRAPSARLFPAPAPQSSPLLREDIAAPLSAERCSKPSLESGWGAGRSCSISTAKERP